MIVHAQVTSTELKLEDITVLYSHMIILYIIGKMLLFLQGTERNEKLEDITSTVLKELTASCVECGISSDIIDEQSFSCFPESPTHVTFRARLRGSSETDSGSLISLLESWVSGGATIIVTGVLMTVDAECSVAISSLSEGECVPDTETTSTTSNTAAIIGGVVVAVLFIIAALVVAGVVIVAFFLKRRQVKQPNSGAKE